MVKKKRNGTETPTDGHDGISVPAKNRAKNDENSAETTPDSGVTPKRRHLSNQDSDVRIKLFENQENEDMGQGGIMAQFNTTLTDVANKINKWESKMRSMENSIKLLQRSTSKGVAKKAKQISSFIRVSFYMLAI